MAKKQQHWPEESEDLDQEDDFKSKSQLKREMQALQTMGETLVALPNAQLDQIPLDDTLSEAIALARRLKNREGKRRQLQYIGKLMRNADTEQIQAKLELFRKDGEAYRRHFHRVEKWRDQLIADGDEAINQLLSEAHYLDRQHLRQLVRQSQREQSQNKPPAASRKLFTYLRDSLEPV